MGEILKTFSKVNCSKTAKAVYVTLLILCEPSACMGFYGARRMGEKGNRGHEVNKARDKGA